MCTVHSQEKQTPTMTIAMHKYGLEYDNCNLENLENGQLYSDNTST